jgi:TolB protein
LGTTTAVAVAGVATFRDLRFDRAGAGYTLIATAPGLSTGASAAITILPLALTGRVAFVSDRNGGEHIYRANPDGSGVTQLTSGSEPDEGPTWSPDGTRIAFGRFGRIYVMQADGSGLVPLADSGYGMEPAWSTDGTRIAYQGPSGGIYIVQADGSGLTPVTELTAGVFGDAHPAWSPDGRQIAFERVITVPDSNYFTQVYVVNADGSGLHRLTETTSPIGIGYASGEPAWSPDGTAIAFWMAGHGLATMRGDGTGAPATVYADCCVGRPTWSPDGTMLAFNNDDFVGGIRQILLVRSDGVVLGSLTGSLNGWDAAWSR